MPTRRMVTAHYDWDSGELGRLEFNPTFLKEYALMRADVLKDLRDRIELHYAAALIDLDKEMNAIRPGRHA